MDESSEADDTKNIKMGASSNPNSSRIATLQERKKGIEDKLAISNKELRKLCIEEAEITGVLPVEFPLEAGETPPVFRRRVGTSYELNKNLINNFNNEEEISAVELEMQILLKKAEAARDLANINNGNKTMRRSLMVEFQQHKQKYNVLEEKLHDLKMSLSNRQSSTSWLSIGNGNGNIHNQMQQTGKHKKKPRPEQEDSLSLNNSDHQAGRQSRHSLRSCQYPVSENIELTTRYNYKVPDSYDSQLRHPISISNSNDGHHVLSSFPRMSLNGYDERNDLQLNHQVNVCRTLPLARKSPQFQEMAKTQMYSPNMMRHTISPSTSSGSSSVKYYPVLGHNLHQLNRTISNPHQLQPHQQYEQNVMTSGGSGLGGYWKQSENGEIWCAANSELTLKDKRFGSLDRRKNKRLQKRMSPSVDTKSVTLSPTENTRTLPASIKNQNVASRERNRHDHRQLVRTQSLGSVGGITLESTRSDDSSSSDLVSGENSQIRKNKPKEWYETSLDGPGPGPGPGPSPAPYYSTPPRIQSAAPSIAPEEKYDEFSSCAPSLQYASKYTQPLSPKEIPAESNPTSKIPETNLEIFNNNIPKNCTVVQQAQWKPYHEETKPFEMADFYKYSTKFKKSAGKAEEPLSLQPPIPNIAISPTTPTVGFRNLPMSPPPSSQSSGSNRNSDISNNISYNSNFDVNAVSPSHLAENFSLEMNAWYQKHEHQKDNNNATLV